MPYSWEPEFGEFYVDEDEADRWATIIAHLAAHVDPTVDEIEAYLFLKEQMLAGPVDRESVCAMGLALQLASSEVVLGVEN